jgi:diacylglycerol O-acyltransferase / wax synthase
MERLEAIKASVKYAKAHVQSLPRAAMQQYTMLLMAPTLITMLTGIGGRIRPMFNITISNVRGPDKPLYFMGAELLATYPASIVTHGQAINITCHSYAGNMNFGYTACHSSLPSMQKIAVYSEDALQDLEKALGVKPAKAVKATKSQAAPSKTSPASKAKSRRKAAAA